MNQHRENIQSQIYAICITIHTEVKNIKEVNTPQNKKINS